jgi:hypothetical protein
MTLRISALSFSKVESLEEFEDDSQEYKRAMHAIIKAFTIKNFSSLKILTKI